MSFDSQLFGIWLAPNGSKFENNSDGWTYSLASFPYLVSPDGQNLNFPSFNPPETFQRVYGQGVSLVGVWKRTNIEDGVTYVEEKHYRSDGTFSIHWTADGVFDATYIGVYQDVGGTIHQRERRALVSTSSNVIFYEPPFGKNYAGTYRVDAPNNQWTLTLGGVDYVNSGSSFP